MTALPSGYTYEHVEVSGGVEPREDKPPRFVDEVLGFWGWYVRGLDGPNIGFPAESPINRFRREREGAGQYGGRHDNEDHYGLFVDIDREIGHLTTTKIDCICWHYWQGLDMRAAAVEMGLQYTAFLRTIEGAKWQLSRTVEPLSKRLRTLGVVYY